MIFPALVVALIASSVSAVPTTAVAPVVIPVKYPYVAPGPNDRRATCPMMNTFANHGIINHNGSDISIAQVTAAFATLNFDSSMVTFFLNGVFPAFNKTLTTFDLSNINTHNNVVEHDASLVRDDVYYHNDAMTTNQTLVQQFIKSSSDGKTITFSDMINWRKVRVADSIKRNPTFNFNEFGLLQGFAASGEATVMLIAFGNGQEKIPLAAIQSILGQNQFPAGYTTPTYSTSLIPMLPTVFTVFMESYPLQFLNPFQSMALDMDFYNWVSSNLKKIF